MKRSAHDIDARAERLVNAVLRPFGRCRLKLGEWSDDSAKKVIAAIKAKGGQLVGEDGMPTAVDNCHFRIGKQRITLSVWEYGSVLLSGPTQLVRELAAQIAA
jgi:hypothetical protein